MGHVVFVSCYSVLLGYLPGPTTSRRTLSQRDRHLTSTIGDGLRRLFKELVSYRPSSRCHLLLQILIVYCRHPRSSFERYKLLSVLGCLSSSTRLRCPICVSLNVTLCNIILIVFYFPLRILVPLSSLCSSCSLGVVLIVFVSWFLKYSPFFTSSLIL